MGEELVAERSSTGAVARRHVYAPGIDEPIVWYEGSGTVDRRWLHADERGSIVATSDASGAVLNVNSYDEYGRTSSSDSLYASRFGYTGLRYFSSLRISYARNRMLHHEGGRFLQSDPIGYGDGMNMYAYVGGDPVNRRDPTGSCGELVATFKESKDGSTGSTAKELLDLRYDYSGCDGILVGGGATSAFDGGGGAGSGSASPPHCATEQLSIFLARKRQGTRAGQRQPIARTT